MKALNRKEVLVNAKANGTLDSFKPLTRDEAFTKKALGLGGGASSWNDLTDKPFGEVTWEEIVAEQSLVLEDMGDHSVASCSATNDLVLDAEYEITFDGETYECVAKALDGGNPITIGNTGLSAMVRENMGGEDTGEPFCVADMGKGMIVGAKTSGVHTISVRQKKN